MDLVSVALIVIGIYLAIMLAIGYWGYRRTRATPEDYYLGNRTLGLLTLSMTFIATYASLWTFLGAVGGNYRLGLTFVSMMMMWNLLWPMMLWVFGPRVWLVGKKYNYITYSELLNDYYGSSLLGVLAAIIGVIALVPYISIQLMGAGIALESFTGGGIPYVGGVLLMFIVMVIYVLIGGLRSVVWTDVIQGIFFLAVMFGLSLYAIHLLGGFGAAFAKIVSENPSLLTPGKLKFGIWIGYVLTWGNAVVLPHMFQRLLMAKKPEIIGKSAASLSILSGWVQTIPVFLLGISATILVPGLTGKATDAATIMFASKYLPMWLAATIVAGAFAAGMSTLDSQLLTSSSLLVIDLYVDPLKKKLPPEKETFLARLLVLILGIIILIFALSRPGLIVPISTAGTAIAISSYFFPLLGALYWPRAGKVAAYGSIIVAGITSIVTWIVLPFPLGIYNVLWGLILGGITYIILGLIAPPPPKESIDKFHGLFKRL